jgi:hypothetical protein
MFAPLLLILCGNPSKSAPSCDDHKQINSNENLYTHNPSVGVSVGVGVMVSVAVGVMVALAVGVMVSVAVGVIVALAVGVMVSVAVGVIVALAVGVMVSVAVGVIVALAVGVQVWVAVAVTITIEVIWMGACVMIIRTGWGGDVTTTRSTTGGAVTISLTGSLTITCSGGAVMIIGSSVGYGV